MGALHEGHCQLLKKSLEDGNQNHIISIFVNPTQFAANEDLGSYPKQVQKDVDAILAIDTNAVFFIPEVSELYPCKNKNMVLPPKKMNQLACGLSRPTHFQGVLTVLTKLLNIVQPDFMYMGKKDYQQLQIVKNMCKDFFFKTSVIGVETVRQNDGLALSSRNAYLSSTEKQKAPQLRKALLSLKSQWEKEENTSILVKKFKNALKNDFKLDYIEILDQENLQKIELSHKACIALAAAYLGKTRLIDNIELPPRKIPTKETNE